MARIARIIAPGLPHHVTQRGNRRQQTFFCDEDSLVYLDLMAQWCWHYNVAVWAWCLMPNHVHLIDVAQTPEDLPRAHLADKDDELVSGAPLLELVPDWRGGLKLSTSEELDLLYRHERTGRPMGDSGFVEKLEQALGRVLQPQKPGPRKKS